MPSESLLVQSPEQRSGRLHAMRTVRGPRGATRRHRRSPLRSALCLTTRASATSSASPSRTTRVRGRLARCARPPAELLRSGSCWCGSSGASAKGRTHPAGVRVSVGGVSSNTLGSMRATVPSATDAAPAMTSTVRTARSAEAADRSTVTVFSHDLSRALSPVLAPAEPNLSTLRVSAECFPRSASESGHRIHR